MEIITAEQAAEAAKGLTFEKVWAALMEMRKTQMETQMEMRKSQMETQKSLDESQKRIEKNFDESQKRIDKSLNDFQKNTDKTIRDLSKNVGGISNTIGQLTESLFSAQLWEKFNELGYPVTRQNKHVIISEGKRVLTEVDLFIENGEYAILVEIKTVLGTSHIDDHLKRIEIVRRYLDERNDNRKLLGAVAGGVVEESVANYAYKRGLFVLVQNGDAVAIADTPHGFKPCEW